MLTEQEAWEALAQAWKNTRAYYTGDGVQASVENQTCLGLCQSVASLRDTRQIGTATYKAMDKKLKKLKKTHGVSQGFAWPLNADGAKGRAAFCKKQARKIEKEVPA